MSGMRTVGVSQKAKRLEKEKKNFWGAWDLWLQPRYWAQFIHEFIGRQRVGSGMGEEISDCVIGVAEMLFGVGKGSFDSGCDKADPGF
jgi:hypothetical protein